MGFWQRLFKSSLPLPKNKTQLIIPPRNTMLKKILRTIAHSNARRAAKFLRDNNFHA